MSTPNDLLIRSPPMYHFAQMRHSLISGSPAQNDGIRIARNGGVAQCQDGRNTGVPAALTALPFVGRDARWLTQYLRPCSEATSHCGIPADWQRQASQAHRKPPARLL